MSVTRWKLAGVTVGIVSVVGGSATAYAWTAHSQSASAPNVASVSASNVSASTAAAKNARLKIAAADAVGWITAITSRLEDKLAEIGSPATITPDQAEHLRVKIRFVSFLQDKAGDLAAAILRRTHVLEPDLDAVG